MSELRHHVIIGGSAAGSAAAVAMRRAGFSGRISLVDAGVYPPYERPPLSKALSAMEEPKLINEIEVYREHDIELELGHPVVALDPATKTVHVEGGITMHADAVLLTTGVSARRLDVPGAELANITTLRDIDDARRMAARMDSEHGPLVIVGGGFIGLEAAAVARDLGIEVTIIEALPVPLLPALGRPLAELIQQLHVDRGVRFVTERTVARFVGDGSVAGVELSDGTVLPASTVVVGIGVVPNDALASAAGIECAGGVIVDALGRTSNPWVWAAGDVATQETPFTLQRQRIEHWDVALRHGAIVGANMAGGTEQNLEVPYFWSDQYGLQLQMFGRPAADDEFVMRPDATPTSFLGFWLRGDTLVAAAGMEQSRELRATKPLIERRVAVTAEALTDPGVSLRSLLKNAEPSRIS